MVGIKGKDVNERLRKFVALGILGMGILLLLSGILTVSGFVERIVSSFGYDSREMQDLRVGINVLSTLSILIGIVVSFISALSLLYPVRASKIFDYISRFSPLLRSKFFNLAFC